MYFRLVKHFFGYTTCLFTLLYPLLLLQTILMTYAGLAIATIDNPDSLPEEYTDDDYDDDYERTGPTFDRFFIIFVLSCSLLCTFGALICDLPCLIGHFITNRVMNHPVFRVLVSYAIIRSFYTD